MAQRDGEEFITIRRDALPVDPKEVDDDAQRFAKKVVAKLVEIARAAKQVEAGRNAEEVAQETGLPEHAIRGWRGKLSGSDASKGRV